MLKRVMKLIGSIDAPRMAQAQADGYMGIPMVIDKSFDGTSSNVSVYSSDAPVKFRIESVAVHIETAGSAAAGVTLKIDDGSNDVTEAMYVNTAAGTVAAGTVVRCGLIVPAYDEIAVGGSLRITLSTTTNAPAGRVVIHCRPVA